MWLYLLLPAMMFGCKDDDTQQVPTWKAVKGTFYVDMHEEGEIEAANAINITAPAISWRYGNMKITHIVKDGEDVKAGDTVVIFDQTEVRKGIVDAEGRLEISYAEMEKMIAEQESAIEELKADLEVTRLSHQISKINFEKANYESEIKKKEIQLNMEQADIALERAADQIENQKKIQQEETKQKNLAIEQDKAKLVEAQETLEKLFVVTPSPGIAIIGRNWTTGNKFQTGDQIWPTYPLIQLPDLSVLKATVRINEVDIAKIEKELKVEIKPDAFSDSVFTGRVSSVANLAVNKDGSTKIKVFPVEITLNETHKNLLPGLTVSCRIIIDQIDDVLYVPIDAVHSEGEENFVYKKSGGGFDKVRVQTGVSNTDHTIIESGLKEGDVVALVDPYLMPKDDEKAKQETQP